MAFWHSHYLYCFLQRSLLTLIHDHRYTYSITCMFVCVFWRWPLTKNGTVARHFTNFPKYWSDAWSFPVFSFVIPSILSSYRSKSWWSVCFVVGGDFSYLFGRDVDGCLLFYFQAMLLLWIAKVMLGLAEVCLIGFSLSFLCFFYLFSVFCYSNFLCFCLFFELGRRKCCYNPLFVKFDFYRYFRWFLKLVW